MFSNVQIVTEVWASTRELLKSPDRTVIVSHRDVGYFQHSQELVSHFIFRKLISKHHVWTGFIGFTVCSGLTLIMVSLDLFILSCRERVRDVLRRFFRTRDSLRALLEPSFPSLISLPDVASEFILRKSRDPIIELLYAQGLKQCMMKQRICQWSMNKESAPVIRGPGRCCLFIGNLKCTEGNEFNGNHNWVCH